MSPLEKVTGRIPEKYNFQLACPCLLFRNFIPTPPTSFHFAFKYFSRRHSSDPPSSFSKKKSEALPFSQISRLAKITIIGIRKFGPPLPPNIFLECDNKSRMNLECNYIKKGVDKYESRPSSN